MRIPSITALVFLSQIWLIECATNSWVWMGGPNQINQAGYDDGQGNYSWVNVPQARSQAATWITIEANSSSYSNATFWMFGGNGYDPSGIHTGRLSDLWSFNGQQWRWVAGSLDMDQNGIYSKNSSTNGPSPGARVSAATWTDSYNKTLWMFGGQGQGSDVDGYLNDLWMYDGIWHWIGGSNTVNSAGVYGSRGISSTPYNWPGARVGAVTWTDRNGTFWMFGGKGWDNSSTFGILSDLWKYDSVAGWIWMSGPNFANAVPAYGPKGTKSPAFYPGGRTGAVGWVGRNDSLWLFGGSGLDANGATGVLNDLWIYDNKGKWGWLGGSNSSNDVGCYDPNCGLYPAPRQDAIAWGDENGNMWLFAGQSYNGSFLSDLWKFDYGSWTWVGGNVSNCGSYGTIYVESPDNIPGARSRASGWKGSDNTFWLFAGQGIDVNCASGRMNDVWRYTYSLPIFPPTPTGTNSTTNSVVTSNGGNSSLGTSAGTTGFVNTTTDVPTTNTSTVPQTVANSSIVLPSSTIYSSTQDPPAMLLSDNKIRTWFPIVLAFSICAFLSLVGIAIGILIVWRRKLLTFGKKDKKPPPKPNQSLSTLNEGASFTYTVSRRESGIVKVNVIPAEDVRFEKVIGKGSFGEVFKGDWDGIEVALKKLKTQSTVALEEFQEETRILRNLNHPNILRIYGLLFEPNGCNFIVTEYCSKGGMDVLLTTRKGRISALELTKMAIQVSIGMQYVHKNKIIHRDLAARNLLVSGERGNYSVKVSDFGMSYMGEEDLFIAPLDVRMPIRWSAPESLTLRHYSFASDVFSFGIIVWELFTFAELPYEELSVAEVHQNVPKGYLLRRPPNAPDILWHFMLSCWDREPKARPTFQQIVDKLSSLEIEVAAAEQGFDQDYGVTVDEYVQRRNHSLDYVQYSKSPGIISTITVS